VVDDQEDNCQIIRDLVTSASLDPSWSDAGPDGFHGH
jgi:hypothetical protein